MKRLPLLVLLLAAQPAYAGSFTISDAWSQPSTSATMGVAYLTLKSDANCTITEASAADVAGVTELHTHLMTDGMMQMRKLDNVTLSPNDVVKFAPGGKHVMLIGLKKPLKDGEHFSLTLKSADCGSATANVEVSKARLLEHMK